MSLFSFISGGSKPEKQQGAKETVEKLCNRVATSTLLEDRRDALRALKSLAKTYRSEVGTQGLHLFINVLQVDKSDSESVGYALDTLYNLVITDIAPSDPYYGQTAMSPETTELGRHFSEVFLQNQDHLPLIINCLEEFDFQIRWPATKLLTALLINNGPQIQQSMLTIPMAVARVVDLLSDEREVVRNEGLLLMMQLTKANNAIQKLIAFENGFDYIIDIIAKEGYSVGGIVVEDCLIILKNLLNSNISNQNFFREGSYIPRLTTFFDLKSANASNAKDDSDTDEFDNARQKAANVIHMLQILRSLVAPDNSQQSLSLCQKVIFQCGLLKILCELLLSSSVSEDIVLELLITVGDILRGASQNQDYASKFSLPADAQRTVIIVLLLNMVNDKTSYPLKFASLYCFKCFLYGNELGQAQLVATLLPSSVEAASISPGQLICAGLFSPDQFCSWCAAVAISHMLRQNIAQKEQLLRVQLATRVGSPAVSLLQQCTNILSENTGSLVGINYLILLCSWLNECPTAVAHLVNNPVNIPFLTTQIDRDANEHEKVMRGLSALLLGICMVYNDGAVEACNRKALRNLIASRIGVGKYRDCLNQISKNEKFVKATHRMQIPTGPADHLYFDEEFTIMFKNVEGYILRIASSDDSKTEINTKKETEVDEEAIVQPYKELIRDQDEELKILRKQCEAFETNKEMLEQQLTSASYELSSLRQQNSLLVEQQNNQPDAAKNSAAFFNQNNDDNVSQELQDMERIKESQAKEIASLQVRLEQKTTELSEYKEIANLKESQTEELNDCRKLIDTLNEQIDELKINNEKLQKDLAEQLSSVEQPEGVDISDIEKLQDKILELDDELSAVIKEKEKVQGALGDLQHEQDDLLLLLSDQEKKIKQLKKTIVSLGGEVSNDEDDDLDM